jgi:hypothetical protein
MKCVYCLDFADGKRYIGSTTDLNHRITGHKNPGNQKVNSDLKAAILQGGYEVVILEQCPDDFTRKQLRAREQHYVDIWYDYGILYNKYKNVSSRDKGKNPAYQRADEIRADRAAGMTYQALRVKYKTGIYTIKDIVYNKP